MRAGNKAPSDGPCRAYLLSIGEIPLLTREQEREIGRRAKAGDESAIEQMVKGNLRLVVKIAGDYLNWQILPLEDLIAEGNLGLLDAARRYDPDRYPDAKFSTYAAWWIKQKIQRAMCNQGREIRIPVHAISKLSKIRKAIDTLQFETGAAPSDKDVAEACGFSVAVVRRLRDVSRMPISLDTTTHEGPEGEGLTLAEVIPDTAHRNAAASSEISDAIAIILDHLDMLEPRLREIICRRFGLRGNARETLEQIADDFDLTRERVRQLQNVALQELRNAHRSFDAGEISRPTQKSKPRRPLKMDAKSIRMRAYYRNRQARLAVAA